MLNSNSKRYVQEQAITTLAMVADASADGFRKVRSWPCFAARIGLLTIFGGHEVLPYDHAELDQRTQNSDGS